MNLYIGDPFYNYVYVYVAYVLPSLCSILDLRSGRHKLSAVPPPRPYRRKMVVHSPVKTEDQRAAELAAQRAQDVGQVPPAVLAAGAAALPARGAATDDLLGPPATSPVHEFDAWNGDTPPERQHVQAEVHAAREEEEAQINVVVQQLRRAR